MKWKINKNNSVNINVTNYSINWSKKAPSKGAQSVKDFLAIYCKHDSLGEELLIPRTKLRIDYINFTKNFAIEFDGLQHSKFSKFMHGSRVSGFLSSMKRDTKKEALLELNGFKVVHITDKDLPLTPKWFEDNYEIYL